MRSRAPDYPTDGAPVSRQVVKSAFELAWDAQLAADPVAPAAQAVLVRQRTRPPRRGQHRRWCHLATRDAARAQLPDAWRQWQLPWRPATPGSYTLLARATDVTGATQPDRATYDTMGYLFDAVVRRPMTVV